ncbi:DUF3618 domain-containing protein [Mariniluteicoccus endophyticus]
MTTSNDPEEIRRDIERTRASLSDDVNALADEAKPGNIAKRQVSSAGDSIREGAQNLKEKIMGSDDSYDYDQGRGRDRAAEAQYAAGYLRAKQGVGAQGPSMGDRAQDARQQVNRAADDARRQVADAPRRVRRGTQGNPLAAGLIAFGVGALLGGLAPATRPERRAVAELKDRAEPYVDQAKEQAQEVAQEMKENLQEPAQQAVANVKDSAADSATTLKEQGQSHAQDVQAHAQDAKDDVQNA